MINNIKKLVLGLAAILAIAGPASATTFNNVPTNGTPVVAYATPSFDDTFNFSLDSLISPYFSVAGVAVSSSSVLDFPAPFPDIVIPAVTFTKFALYELGSTVEIWSATPGTSFFSKSGILEAGDYTLRIWGTADATYGGGYVVALQAAPVPEPGEWAMILAGLGIVGFMARRRTGAR
jgi:hypothetical protein